jgi:hypothetical protein
VVFTSNFQHRALTTRVDLGRDDGARHHHGRFEELDPIRPMTVVQTATLKRLAEAAYEPDAFKPNLTRDEAAVAWGVLSFIALIAW